MTKRPPERAPSRDLLNHEIRRFAKGSQRWEIVRDDHTHTVRTKGRTASVRCDSDEAANAAALALVAAKVEAGFAEVDPGATGAPALDPKRLAKQLAKLEPLAFAAWLTEQGHPWGKLIALQHAIAAAPKKAAALQDKVDKLLAADGAAILGPFAAAHGSRWTWDLGFLRRAEVACRPGSQGVADAARGVCALPAAARLETLVLAPRLERFPTWRSWEQSYNQIENVWWELDKLARAVPPELTRLGFGAWPASAADAYLAMPNFDELSRAFPALTHLELTGFVWAEHGTLKLPKLTELAMRFARAEPNGIAALAKSKLPKLERLEVWLGGASETVLDDVHPAGAYEGEDQDWRDRYPVVFTAEDLAKLAPPRGIVCNVDAKALRPLLDATWPVKHLSFGGPAVDAALLAAVVKSPLVKRATALELTGAVDEPTLIAAKKSLAHLATLRVPRASAKLRAALPKVDIAAAAESNDFHFRFVATVE
jgi:hypothetical protein